MSQAVQFDPNGNSATVPATLQAEHDELARKREQLRAELERARAKLAALRSTGKPA